jgi:Flp pilus assembly pilin Flp
MQMIADRFQTACAALHVLLHVAVRRLGVAARSERGQGMLEYAIIGGIIIVGAVATLAALSGALNRLFTQITTTLGQY